MNVVLELKVWCALRAGVFRGALPEHAIQTSVRVLSRRISTSFSHWLAGEDRAAGGEE